MDALERYSSAAINTFNTLNFKVDNFGKSGSPLHNIRYYLSVLFDPIETFHDCFVKGVPAADVETAKMSATKAYDSLLDVARTFDTERQIHIPDVFDKENEEPGPYPHPTDP